MCRRLVGVVALVLCFAGLACAADSPLSLLPKRTLAFVLVNHLADSDAHVVALGKALRTPLPSMISILKAQAGVVEGLDEKRSAMFVLVAGEDDDAQPITMLYLPVTDYDTFIKQLKPKSADGLTQVRLWGSQFLATKESGYAVFTELEHADAFKEALSAHGMPDELKPIQDFLVANDASAVGTRKGIEKACGFVRTSIGMLRGFMAGQSDEQKMAAMAMDMYLSLFETLDKETAAVALGLNLDPSGQIRLTGRARLNPSGAWAAKMKTSQTPAVPLLSGIPQMPFVAAGGFVGVRDVGEGTVWGDLIKMSVRLMSADEADAKAIMQPMRDLMGHLQSTSMVMAAATSAGPLFRDTFGVLATDDAKLVLNAYEKQFQLQNKIIAKSSLPVKTEYKTERVRVADLDALRVTTTIPLGGDAAVLEAAQVLDKLFGPGGKLVIHMIAVDAKRLLFVYCTTGKDLEKLVQTVRDSKTQLSADASVAQTAALLPKNAIALGYLSPQGAIVFANRIINMIGAFAPAEVKVLPEFPASPPLGAALTTAPAEVQFDIVVPRETAAAVGKYIEKIQGK